MTRFWHWVLVLVIGTGWSFGKFMTFETVRWHFYLGYAVLALLAFRYLWGFVGPAPIRYPALLPRPGAILDYLRHIARREPGGTPGHNPLGALSVIAMLLAITIQAVSGLFMESEDFFEYGPLSGYVSEAIAGPMNWLHRVFADVVLVLVVLHVSAILFYLVWKRENLIRPMLTGWKLVKSDPED